MEASKPGESVGPFVLLVMFMPRKNVCSLSVML